MKRTSLLSAALVTLALSSGLGGCIVYTDPAPTHAQVYCNSAPPARYVETRSSYPGSGYFWVDGYWAWRGNQWAWVGGHWERERVGYVYVTPTYNYQSGKHVYNDGGWQKQQGYKTSNSNKSNYKSSNGSNGNNGYGNSKGSNGSNGNGNGNNKCPQGYVWSNGQCQASNKNY